ncbi:STAS domain-containing protein [Amycolatopsis nalaikhensis]|uniref:Anti-sigma factor antagonist n=1 Tax=Amycolatopsis nalaikhensis TaxID=715472 RepID=A0ABY8XQE4_9PSEU|nr:STAS domain-containing protein [Amycolatopsis sp. 2-2]WIV57828.1 STAS domain-containing protein [Amycolatopsis sp. 2-2]
MNHSELGNGLGPRLGTSVSRSLLRLTSMRREDVLVLTAAGEVDLSTTPALSESLADAIAQRPPALVVDLTPTTFLACAGLSVLLAAHQLTGDRACFAVVAGSRASWRPLHLTGVDRLLTVHRHLDDAVAGAAPMVVRTVVADAAILFTATGGARAGAAEVLTEELRQVSELCRGVVLVDVSACTVPAVDVVGSVRAAFTRDGRDRGGIRVLTADEDLRKALEAAGIACCVPAGPGR